LPWELLELVVVVVDDDDDYEMILVQLGVALAE